MLKLCVGIGIFIGCCHFKTPCTDRSNGSPGHSDAASAGLSARWETAHLMCWYAAAAAGQRKPKYSPASMQMAYSVVAKNPFKNELLGICEMLN